MAPMVIPREQILSLLREGPRRIAGATGGVASERLCTRLAPEEWSANEVLAHLRACADVWGGCMHRIIEEDHPTIRAINPRTWMDKTDYPELEFWASPRRMDTKLRSTYNQLGDQHEREAEEIQQTVQTGCHSDV